MKLGLAVPAYRRFAERATMLRVAQTADDHGYYSTWVPDHLISPDENRDFTTNLGERWLDPFTFLAYVAGRTRQVRLGIGVVVLPYRHPILAAKQIATLDIMSEGRLIVAVGTGHLSGEFSSINVPLGVRGPMSDEYLEAMKGLWTQRRPEFHGQFASFGALLFEPKPHQQPHPPLWVGGNSRAAMRRAVTLADGWHPLRLSPEELAPEIAALKDLAARHERPLPFISLHGEWIRIAGVGNWQARADRRLPLNGTPEQLVEDIRQYAEMGVQHLVLRFGAAESIEEFYAALDVFESKVRPHVGEG